MLSVLQDIILSAPKQMISYSTYMSTVLYHPECGYYMKEKEKIGRSGDFYTSSNVSSIFARQFAQFFIALTEAREVPAAVCEIGGGTGQFAYDVLMEWMQQSPDTFSKLTYYLVETSPHHRSLQKDKLYSFTNVRQCAAIDEIEDFEGIVFSNELFDAFPVHVIEKRGNSLYEVFVALDKQQCLEEKICPLDNEEIFSYLKKHKLQLKEGQRFEIPLAMEHYVHKLGAWLQRGICVTVDYGYTNEEWMNPIHREGSLRGYYEHQLIRNPLLHAGQMDLTTHIHWDALKAAGREAGLETLLQTKQTYFLLATGILNRLTDHNDRNPFSEKNKQNRAIRSMVGGMSDAFDVVIQQKNLPYVSINKYINTVFLPV
ncbi:class I SAM-dependent methyltransferase [Ectobacillus panaciterrae]|uniref:class I SAM-dependent methyltransferase n=1 Tax=Ectobacillus panaciterrae TaxID=363872 RepID=UPI0003F7161C|nr:SAM-dependent methyltransferase [Ectobacillus panaciterrae]